MVKLRRSGLEALKLTLNCILESCRISRVGRGKKLEGDVHIVRDVFNGHYLDVG